MPNRPISLYLVERTVTLHQAARSPHQNILGLALDVSWWVWFVAIAPLFFLAATTKSTLFVIVFMAGSMVYVLARPGLALKAVFSSWIPWIFVLFAAMSVAWSQYPDWTLRASIQLAFSTGAFLVMVRALPAKSFLTVFLSANLLVDAASLANPTMALNTGGMAMIGIFGSKNSFATSLALLIQVGVWVLLDHGQRTLMRALALIGVVGGAILIVAALSVGTIISVSGALACSLLAFNLRHFPPRSRVVILCAGGIV